MYKTHKEIFKSCRFHSNLRKARLKSISPSSPIEQDGRAPERVGYTGHTGKLLKQPCRNYFSCPTLSDSPFGHRESASRLALGCVRSRLCALSCESSRLCDAAAFESRFRIHALRFVLIARVFAFVRFRTDVCNDYCSAPAQSLPVGAHILSHGVGRVVILLQIRWMLSSVYTTCALPNARLPPRLARRPNPRDFRYLKRSFLHSSLTLLTFMLVVLPTCSRTRLL